MVNFQEAYELAKLYSKSLGELLPEIYFDVSPTNEFEKCFYFDFIIVDEFGKTLEEPPMIGGAPGSVVDKLSGEVKTVSFGELSTLK